MEGIRVIKNDYWPLFWMKILGSNRITRSALGVSHRCKYISQLFYKNRIKMELGNMRIKTAVQVLSALHRCTPGLRISHWLPRKPPQCPVLTNEHLTKLLYFTLGSFPGVCFCALFAFPYSKHSQHNFSQDSSFSLGYSSLSDVTVIRFSSPFRWRKTSLLKNSTGCITLDRVFIRNEILLQSCNFARVTFLFLQIYQTADSKKSSC